MYVRKCPLVPIFIPAGGVNASADVFFTFVYGRTKIIGHYSLFVTHYSLLITRKHLGFVHL